MQRIKPVILIILLVIVGCGEEEGNADLEEQLYELEAKFNEFFYLEKEVEGIRNQVMMLYDDALPQFLSEIEELKGQIEALKLGLLNLDAEFRMSSEEIDWLIAEVLARVAELQAMVDELWDR